MDMDILHTIQESLYIDWYISNHGNSNRLLSSCFDDDDDDDDGDDDERFV